MRAKIVMVWVLTMVFFLIMLAVIFVSGQLVGQIFPRFQDMAGEDAYVELFPLIEDTMLIWLPMGLTAAVLLWAGLVSVIWEAFRAGRR